MKPIIWTLAVISLTAACRQQSSEVRPEQDSLATGILTLSQEQYGAANVTLGKISRRQMPVKLKVNGTLDVPPQNLVTISAPMGGFVKSTTLLQGMRIRKGEVIAVLEHQDYVQLQQDYLDYSSKLEFLEMEYKRQEELARENVNSQKVFQQAKSNYGSAMAQVEGLAAKLRMLNIDAAAIARHGISSEIRIYSPISGFVAEVNVNIGSFVQSADPMFRIVDVKHLHAEVRVYEKDIHSVHIGQKVEFHLPGEMMPRTASVFLVGKEITADRTVRVHCHLDKEDENLLPGMFIAATIEIQSQESEAVPSTAVVNFQGQQGIFVKRGERQFELVDVKVSNSNDGFTVIAPAPVLLMNDSIVIEGSFALLGMLKNLEQ